MPQEALIDRLGTVAIFRGLDEKELHRIAEVGKEVHFEPGAVVAQQDGGAAGFHLIMDGEVSIDVDGHERARLGAAARALVEANRGAKTKTLAVIADLVPPAGSGAVIRPFRLVH